MYYADLNDFWNKWYGSTPQYSWACWKPRLVETTAEVVREYGRLDTECSSLLELGCGSGRNLWVFHEHYPDMVLEGIDIVREAFHDIEKIRPEILSLANLVCGDAKKHLKKQADNSWDIILTYGFLMHMPPKGGAITKICKEIERVASKLIITVNPNPQIYNSQGGENQWKWVREYMDYFTGELLTRKDLETGQTLWIFEA